MLIEEGFLSVPFRVIAWFKNDWFELTHSFFIRAARETSDSQTALS
jgi:hypothetical protein